MLCTFTSNKLSLVGGNEGNQFSTGTQRYQYLTSFGGRGLKEEKKRREKRGGERGGEEREEGKRERRGGERGGEERERRGGERGEEMEEVNDRTDPCVFTGTHIPPVSEQSYRSYSQDNVLVLQARPNFCRVW